MGPSYYSCGKLSFFVTLLFFLCNIHLYSQWSTDPANPLVVGYGINPEMCSDGAGGCYITYESGNGLLTELNLRWFNRYGIQPWGWKKIIKGAHQQQETAKLLPDGEGGVIICYEDRDYNGEARLRLQRVDTVGNFLWGPIGVPPSIADTMQSVQRLASDWDGGCIVLWLENTNSGLITRLNRINKFGERVWSDTGSFIALQNSTNPSELIPCTDGNYFIYYYNALFKVNNLGQVIWSKYISFGRGIGDGGNGLYEYSQNWANPTNHKVIARRMDSSGVNIWPSSVVVADSIHLNANVNWIRIENYVLFSWYGIKNGVDVYQFQILRGDGTKVFNESKQLPGYVANLMASDSSRVYFNLSGSSLVSQCYDTLGNQLFVSNGVTVTTPTIGYVKNTSDGLGGIILAGTFSNSSIVVQKVSRNGTLGEVIIPVELTNFTAEVLKNKVLLKWQTATEINNKGFEIERITKQGSKVIGFVNGNGTTTEVTNYSFTDNVNLYGLIKYKLKQIDFDGAYKYSNTIQVNVGAPDEFILYQNYPNPFNSSTVIKFNIPQEENVKLSIFDVLGQEIHTILNEKKESGFYNYSYYPRSETSGVYFIRLKAGNFTAIKKILLLK